MGLGFRYPRLSEKSAVGSVFVALSLPLLTKRATFGSGYVRAEARYVELTLRLQLLQQGDERGVVFQAFQIGVLLHPI